MLKETCALPAFPFLVVIRITPLAAREPYREAAAASLIIVMFSISAGFSVLMILVLELFI